MELLLLVLVFAVIGYLVGISRLGSQADRATESAARVSQNWVDRLGSRWKSTFRSNTVGEDFRHWVASQSSESFSEDERKWLNDLSDDALKEYVKSLDSFSRGLGYNLNQLIEGGLDAQPRMRQVFVEAITVYSSAYRKAKLAQQEAKTAPESQNEAAEPDDGKTPAEKAPSRRKADENQVMEPASTD